MNIKKIFILSLLSFAFCANFQLIYAQNPPSIVNNFSIKKGTESLVLQQLEIFMRDILKLGHADQEGNYIGTFENMYCTRKGFNKNIYSIDYKIKPLISSGKVIINYWIVDVIQYSIVCDKTQKQTKTILNVSGMPIGLKDAFEDVVKNTTDCMRDYIKKGKMDASPQFTKRPYWYPLNYIIDNNAVSYFTVLNSSKGLSKEKLYKVFENYFTYAYGSGKAVIENKNPQDCSIIAKGIYANVHQYSGWSFENYDVKHIVNIQCRDGRVRITITIGNYDIQKKNKGLIGPNEFTRNIAAYEPFGSEKDDEMIACLKKVELRIIDQFEEMQKVIDEGNTAVDMLDNW